MAEMSPGLALRQLQQAQNALRKVRQAMVQTREGGLDPERVLRAGWNSLQDAHRVLASIPFSAASSDEVVTRQIALQRYATSLLVRLRRLARKGTALDDLDEDDGDEA